MPTNTSPHRVPLAPTPLVGRAVELDSLCRLIRRAEVRLVTLTGTGGTGKTRLALAAAYELGGEYPDGVHFVHLAPVSEPALVATAIAAALGLRDTDRLDPQERLTAHLAGREVLLVLDNFEQVVAAAPLLAALLEEQAGLRLLVTSRERLRLRGEHEMALAPLRLPDLHRLPSAEALAQNEAVSLLIARAQAIRPDFHLTEHNAAVVAEICARLDGLPLAIELAAARLRLLTPEALLAGLSIRLDLLGQGARDLPERQQTLRQAIGWSFRLLTEREQALFTRLSVFAGSFGLAAVQALYAEGTDQLSVMDELSGLVDKSLVRPVEPQAAEPRFQVLETIREFGAEALAQSGDGPTARSAHARHFLALAEAAESQITGPDQLPWLDRLEVDRDNLLAAFDWLLEQPDAAQALGLGCALRHFVLIRGPVRPMLQRMRRALDLPSRPDSAELHIPALEVAGEWAWLTGDYELATSLAEAAMLAADEAGDALAAADLRQLVGLIYLDRGEVESARAHFVAGAEVYRERGHKLRLATSLHNLGIAMLNGRDGAAEARIQLAAAAEIAEQLGVPTIRAFIGASLAFAELQDGDRPAARRSFRAALPLLEEVGDVRGLSLALAGLAVLLAADGEADVAVRLWAAAAVLRNEIGVTLPPLYAGQVERFLVTTRAQLAPAAWATAYKGGQTMPTEAATAAALEALERPRTVSRAGKIALPGGLTAREVEILRLVAAGFTDAEVAAGLIISPRTVSTHLQSIYGKLSVGSRAAATRFAVEHDLVEKDPPADP